MVRPVSGSSRVTPATTTNSCSAIEERQPGGEQLAERVAHRERGGEAAGDEDARRARAAPTSAEQADLLAERGDDEVGRRQRHEFGVPAAEPGAEDAAGAEPEQRLAQLVAVVVVLAASNRCSQTSTRVCTVPNSW